jgi:hypothetical protein
MQCCILSTASCASASLVWASTSSCSSATDMWRRKARVGARGVALAVAGFTSILRPSTMAPCSCSLAQAASPALPRVMKPKPFEPFSLKMISASMTRP